MNYNLLLHIYVSSIVSGNGPKKIPSKHLLANDLTGKTGKYIMFSCAYFDNLMKKYAFYIK